MSVRETLPLFRTSLRLTAADCKLFVFGSSFSDKNVRNPAGWGRGGGVNLRNNVGCESEGLPVAKMATSEPRVKRYRDFLGPSKKCYAYRYISISASVYFHSYLRTTILTGL